MHANITFNSWKKVDCILALYPGISMKRAAENVKKSEYDDVDLMRQIIMYDKHESFY